MNGFCLYQSQDWKAVGVHPTPIFIHLRNTLNTKVYQKQCRFLIQEIRTYIEPKQPKFVLYYSYHLQKNFRKCFFLTTIVNRCKNKEPIKYCQIYVLEQFTQPTGKLCGALWQGEGGEKEGELATTSLEFEYIICIEGRCEMLIRRDNIRVDWWKSDCSVNRESQGNWKWNSNSRIQVLLINTGIQYVESGIHRVESRIHDCPGFPFIGSTPFVRTTP